MPGKRFSYGLKPCALCHFDIAPGDEILIGTTLCYQRLKWNPEDPHVQLVLRNSIRISALREARYPALGGFTCYHVGCLEVAGLEDGPQLIRFVDAMKYQRLPSLLQKVLRRRQLLTCLSTELSEHFALQGTNLPLELWHKVAAHLLPHYAAANARSLWRRTEPEVVRLTEEVWCKYLEFEGIRYVARLSNTPSDGCWELAYRPSGETIKYLFTRENHFGVMDLRFSAMPNLRQVEETPGIWWRRACITDADVALRARSDGLKFRYFIGTPRDIVACNIPLPDGVRLANLAIPSPKKLPAYMSSLVFNQPSVTGYSVLWADSVVTIYAHHGIEDWRCYQSATTTGTWLHMPVDPGEVITEIWGRPGDVPRQRGLGFKTNLGRIFFAGAYCACFYRRPGLWSLLARPGQSRVFFGDSDSGITLLAFEDPRPMGPNLPFSPPPPSVEPPVRCLGHHFYSNHCLTGLVRVTPCRAGDRPGLTGMLLHYSNGHRESVGQVRLDCLCLPISLQDRTSWYLAFKAAAGGKFFYLAAIMATPPSPDSGFEKVVQLFFEGTLEWYWSSLDCHVLYNGTGW
ncbi:hypothetical protein CCMA1212_004128 [Trichoderma ghanense]|uniref:F-box domain-containing protein n=1 Tax=Trichoderma ghanense TaxID=65468 RepID=A0ABY2H7L1_9HYPO